MRSSRVAAIAATSLIVVLAGCSNSLNKKATSASMPAAAATSAAASSAASESAPAGAGAAYGDGQNIQSGPGAATASPAAGGTKTIVRARVASSPEDIIKVATISVEAADVDRATNEAAAEAIAHGADVTSETQAGTGKEKSATIVFRVLPGDFDKFVTALGSLTGTEVVSRNVASEDVTGQVADIDGRIRAAKDSAEKIRALIQRADKIADLVQLEREYESRDAEIQSMASQLASLKDRAGRSTVTLNIAPAKEKPKAAAPAKKRRTGFTGGLSAGWDAFTKTAAVVATAVGALLPFLGVAALIGLVWWVIRRRRPARPAPLEPATPYAAPTA